MKKISDYNFKESSNKFGRRGGPKSSQKLACPFCGNQLRDARDGSKCRCNYHIAYCYRMYKEKSLKVIQKSKQRGGPARLMDTPIQKHLELVDTTDYSRKNREPRRRQVNLRTGFSERPMRNAEEAHEHQP